MAPCGLELCPHLHARCWQSDAPATKSQKPLIILEDCHEVPPASRPRSRQAHRRRGKDCRWHHYPGHRQSEASQGEIVAVGPGGRDEAGKLIPIDLKVGDTVLFGKWSGTEVKIDGQDLLIMKESDIMGVIEGGATAKRKAA